MKFGNCGSLDPSFQTGRNGETGPKIQFGNLIFWSGSRSRFSVATLRSVAVQLAHRASSGSLSSSSS